MKYVIDKKTYISGDNSKNLYIIVPFRFCNNCIDTSHSVKLSSIGNSDINYYLHNDIIKIIAETHHNLPRHMRKISNIFVSKKVSEITITDTLLPFARGSSFTKYIKIGQHGRELYNVREKEIIKIIHSVLLECSLTKENIITNLNSCNSINTKKVVNSNTIDISTMKQCYDWNYVINEIKDNFLLETLRENNIIKYDPLTLCYTI